MQTASNAPTNADLIAAHIASKGVTVCPPANAVPPTPQSAPVVNAKTAERVKRAVAKTAAAAEKLTTPDAPTKPAKKASTAPKTKKSAAPAERATINPGKTSLASICAELNVHPKSARAILRRHMTKPDSGWTFDANAAKKVRALLAPKK